MFIRRFMQVGVSIFITIALALSAQAATNASLKGSYSFLSNRVDRQCEHQPVCQGGSLDIRRRR